MLTANIIKKAMVNGKRLDLLLILNFCLKFIEKENPNSSFELGLSITDNNFYASVGCF